MKMTRHRWIAVGIGVAVFLAAFSVALAVTIRFQVSRQVPSNLNVFEVSVLKDERLGLYFDKEATKPVEGLSFGLLKLKEPLRSHETGTRSVFVRNESGIDLFLIEPCRDVEVDGKHIGFMNPEILDLEGHQRGRVCDRPRVRLTPGELVEARVNVHDLTQELEAKQYSFTTVFGAVGSRRSVEPPAGMIGRGTAAPLTW